MRPPVWIAWPFVAQLGLGVALCFVPLFDLLAYEFAFAVTLLAVPTSMALGLGAGRVAPRLRLAVAAATTLAVAHLVPPLVLISANALRVRNCDYLDGLAFYALLPLPTALYAALLGVTIARVAPRRALQRTLAALVCLVPLGQTLARLYLEPPIFAYDHLWGHFAGSLYDETINLGATLVVFRLGTLVRAALLVGFAVAWQRRVELGRLRLAAAGAVVVLTAALYDAALGPRLGYRVSRADIERALPVVVEVPGAVLHLPARAGADERQALADEAAYHLELLGDRLGVTPAEPIAIYVYANADEKAALMGGRTTQIAKPWLGEIHVHDLRVPHRVMAHELVHALAAAWAAPPLHVPAEGWWWPNMGLTEGLAEALTVEEGDVDLDHWAAALRRLELAPDLERLLSPTGFWSAPSARAYTVAGSFVRHLLRIHGTAPFARVYRDGDFAAAYGQPLAALLAEWHAALDRLPVGEAELRLATDRFRQPSIFARPCAHEIAALRAAAARAEPAAAVEVQQQICAHLGQAPSCQLDLALARLRAGDQAGFAAAAEALLADERLNAAQRARLLESRGSSVWKAGELAAARADFSAVLALGLGADNQRLQWVRLWALDRPEQERWRRFLDQELDPLAAVLSLDQAARAEPDERTLPYLIARQLVRVGDLEAARTRLHQAAGHPFAPIEAERRRLLAECAFRLGEWQAAAEAFDAYAASAPTSGEAARARDAAARSRWRAARQARPAGDGAGAPGGVQQR